jgi:hypothetical protein
VANRRSAGGEKGGRGFELLQYFHVPRHDVASWAFHASGTKRTCDATSHWRDGGGYSGSDLYNPSRSKVRRQCSGVVLGRSWNSKVQNGGLTTSVNR